MKFYKMSICYYLTVILWCGNKEKINEYTVIIKALLLQSNLLCKYLLQNVTNLNILMELVVQNWLEKETY